MFRNFSLYNSTEHYTGTNIWVKMMTENYEKGDILQMIEHIDTMKNSNTDRVQEIYREVDSYTVDKFNPKEVEWLSTNECKAWLYGQLGEDNYGQFGWLSEYGIGFQHIGQSRLRCISLYDDPPAIYNLAWLKFAIESLGGIVELGDFTILRMPPKQRKQYESGFFPKSNPSAQQNTPRRRETSVEVI